MKLPWPHPGLALDVDLDAVVDISNPISFADGPTASAFFLPTATATAFEAEGFVGDTGRGGSVNCHTLSLSPHGNGTHTECVGHIVNDPVTVPEVLKGGLFRALLLTVDLVGLGDSDESYRGRYEDDDDVITAAAVKKARAALAIGDDERFDALVIRTRMEGLDKRFARWSGTNPPYPTYELLSLLEEWQVTHLVLDVPSLDREDDGGLVPNHHRYWGLGEGSRNLEGKAPSPRTVTELALVPAHVADGRYLLDLQVPPLLTDAVPSRPLLYPAIPSREQT